MSLCGSLSLVAGLETTHKSVAIYGHSQSPAVLIQRLLGLEVGVPSCRLGQQHLLCVCTFMRVQTGALAGLLLLTQLGWLASKP